MLLEATSSEPLSIQEEYDMQQSWKDDESKCTFIIHAKINDEFTKNNNNNNNNNNNTESLSSPSSSTTHIKTSSFHVNEHLDTMVGDVNLFLSPIDNTDDDDDDDDDEEEEENEGMDKSTNGQKGIQAEIDIMIAEKDYRRQGLGRTAVCMMMVYAIHNLKRVERFFCKINENNQASIELFTSLDFKQCNYAECFQQVELELYNKSKEEMKEILICHGGSYQSIPCPINSRQKEDE